MANVQIDIRAQEILITQGIVPDSLRRGNEVSLEK
jgi:hypothetical protein